MFTQSFKKNLFYSFYEDLLINGKKLNITERYKIATEIFKIDNTLKKINISEDTLEYYGKYKAKIPLTEIDQGKINKSNLIFLSILQFGGNIIISFKIKSS